MPPHTQTTADSTSHLTSLSSSVKEAEAWQREPIHIPQAPSSLPVHCGREFWHSPTNCRICLDSLCEFLSFKCTSQIQREGRGYMDITLNSETKYLVWQPRGPCGSDLPWRKNVPFNYWCAGSCQPPGTSPLGSITVSEVRPHCPQAWYGG